MICALTQIPEGIRSGFPLCCVLRFAWDTLRCQPAALRRGIAGAVGEEWVPCGIFHRATEVYDPMTGEWVEAR